MSYGLAPLRGYLAAAAGAPASFWDLRLYWSESEMAAAPGDNKQLMTSSAMTALGITSSGGANGTRIDSSGKLVAATAPRITCDMGGAQIGLLIEPQRTRETLHPRDLTQGVWERNCTISKTATGVTGVVNSASTLTATGANQYCGQAVSGTSATRSLSAYVRARSASTVTFDMTPDGGTTKATFTATTTWQRFAMSKAALANPFYGFGLYNSGDSIDVDFVQGEVGPVASTPIWGTESAAQTRTADTVTGAVGTFPITAAYTLSMSATQAATSNGEETRLARDTGGLYLYRADGVQANRSYDGTNLVAVANASRYDHTAVSRGSNGMALCTLNSAVDRKAWNGSSGTGSLFIGHYAGATPYMGTIHSLEFATHEAADAQLQLASLGQLP